jgi:hypothetical protein
MIVCKNDRHVSSQSRLIEKPEVKRPFVPQGAAESLESHILSRCAPERPSYWILVSCWRLLGLGRKAPRFSHTHGRVIEHLFFRGRSSHQKT